MAGLPHHARGAEGVRRRVEVAVPRQRHQEAQGDHQQGQDHAPEQEMKKVGKMACFFSNYPFFPWRAGLLEDCYAQHEADDGRALVQRRVHGDVHPVQRGEARCGVHHEEQGRQQVQPPCKRELTLDILFVLF